MSKLTCRGCGKPESECTCNVPTIDKDTEIEKLRARIAELEELIPTKDEAEFIIKHFAVTDASYNLYLSSIGLYTKILSKLQKIIDKRV